MMLSQVQDIGTTRKVTDTFYGYYHGKTVGEGFFYDEQNMSHRDYPLLSTRPVRTLEKTFTRFQGILVKDALCWVDNGNIYINNEPVADIVLTIGEKQLVSMGAYLLIWPDKAYVNTQDTTDRGYMEASTSASGVSCRVCDENGDPYTISASGTTAPTDPQTGDKWMDTGNHALKTWDGESKMWIEAASVYVRFEGGSIGKPFAQYDGVTISGITNTLGTDLNGSHVIMARGDGWFSITGIIDQSFTNAGAVTVKRTVPEMDFVTECDNRIWGCKYGMVMGETVNEIYASALGSFKVWDRFMGLSTDSYAASRGSDGQFTGAITWDGHPLFFKENCIEKVYPSSSGAHQITTQQARGVQKGCHKSLKIVGETLFYKSVMDVCAYSGAQPTSVSEPLGDIAYTDAVAGVIRRKYYISMKQGTERVLFVYDLDRGTWHKEDGLNATDFAFMDGELYAVADNKLWCLTKDGVGDVAWYMETGNIGFIHNRKNGEFHPDHKYLSRFQIRAAIEGAARFWVKYDNDTEWTMKGSLTGSGRIEPYVVPVMPRRCDHMRLRLDGEGKITLYSIAYLLEQGSEVI